MVLVESCFTRQKETVKYTCGESHHNDDLAKNLNFSKEIDY